MSHITNNNFPNELKEADEIPDGLRTPEAAVAGSPPRAPFPNRYRNNIQPALVIQRRLFDPVTPGTPETVADYPVGEGEDLFDIMDDTMSDDEGGWGGPDISDDDTEFSLSGAGHANRAALAFEVLQNRLESEGLLGTSPKGVTSFFPS